MHDVVTLEPAGVYDDGSLHLLLGLTPAALAKGRREGTLKHSRKGARVFYLGRWVLDWLEADDGKGGAR
jgi:hypothetical protein